MLSHTMVKFLPTMMDGSAISYELKGEREIISEMTVVILFTTHQDTKDHCRKSNELTDKCCGDHITWKMISLLFLIIRLMRYLSTNHSQ
jgi:hypothetical protein